MKPFLMIDIGTSSLRVVLLDDNGTVIDSCKRQWSRESQQVPRKWQDC